MDCSIKSCSLRSGPLEEIHSSEDKKEQKASSQNVSACDLDCVLKLASPLQNLPPSEEDNWENSVLGVILGSPFARPKTGQIW